MNNKIKSQKFERRRARTRAKIFGISSIPRLSVFRSLKNISCQLIDDEEKKTLVAANEKEIKKLRKEENKDQKSDGENKMTTKVAVAFEVGKILAKKALEKNIKKCVFDKSGYKYHGRIKALADGAREGGLKF